MQGLKLMLDPGIEKDLPPIPAKRYFTIGEVSELCGVKPHVLRYWEQEFEQLKKQMEASHNSSIPKVTPKQLTNSKFRPDIEQDEDSDDSQREKKTPEEEQIIDDET